MKENLESLAATARSALESASSRDEVEALRVRYLGKKGELTRSLGGMGKLAPEDRKALGQVANRVKGELEGWIAEAHARVEAAALKAELEGPGVDVTLPGRSPRVGTRHPVSRTLEDIVRVFSRLGFSVEEGPEIELERLNFDALNFPPEHPARDMQDTFYVEGDWLSEAARDGKETPLLLRTHTSPVQTRTMLRESRAAEGGPKLPIRIIAPGRVYRSDSDLTHTPMFHQVEGLLVDERVTFAELKGTLAAFATAFFGSGVKTRFRPSFFPFTEPSSEVDVSCVSCGGKGCRICSNTGWLEVLGAGMVHPNVFRSAGYDPEKVSGFAFGMGIERLAMLRYKIDDLRKLFENDARFLRQL